MAPAYTPATVSALGTAALVCGGVLLGVVGGMFLLAWLLSRKVF